MEDLSKCSACGGTAEVKLDPFTGQYFATCRVCGKSTERGSASHDYAAKDWNKMN